MGRTNCRPRPRSAVVLLAALLVVCGAAGKPASLMQTSVTQAPAYQAGELVVKFKADQRLSAPDRSQRKGALVADTGSARLDALHQRYHVTDIHPLVSALPSQRRAARGDWTANLASIRRRFAVRGRRGAPQPRLPDLSRVYVVVVPADTDIRQLAAEYGADPSVEYAEPNYIYRPAFTPNDPLFSSSGSWGQKFPDLWGLHNIQADKAWDLATGAGVTVAVIDTGLNTAHPDIRANLWVNPGEVDGNGLDDDGNGFIDDVSGWDFVRHRGLVQDTIGHGTHVAGTIAAVGNNGAGVLGVAWQAHVMPLAVFDDLGLANSVSIAAALMYAVQNGADVANMSFAGLGDAFLLRDAIDYAAANGLVLVAAAGNDAIDVKTVSPADLDPVIAVGAVDHLDQPASFSNYGGKIELVAPGGGDSAPPRFQAAASVLSLAATSAGFDPRLLLTGQLGNETFSLLRLAGTSMAAPHVSGTAALILSRHPEFSVEQVRQALRDGADDVGPPGRDGRYGYGRLNAARAVARDSVVVTQLTAPRQLSRLHGESITLEGTVRNPGGIAPSWQLQFGPQGGPPTVLASGTGEVDHAVLASLDTGPLARGNYVVRLEATGSGATSSDTLTFTRLANRPYVRQLSDQGGVPTLRHDAWSQDGETLVWTDIVGLGSYRVVATDLVDASERTLSQFQIGTDSPLVNSFVPVEAVISGDGATVAFTAPQDLSVSNTDIDNRNFQLFLLNLSSGVVQQASYVSGVARGGLQGLAITPDASRIVFTSGVDFDPAAGNPGIFYWDRATAGFHQVTNAATPLTISSPVISADGKRIAFVSTADLDPSVGNGAHVFQVFVYDVPGASVHQLTQMTASGVPLRRLSTEIALSPDGSTVAGSIDSLFASDPASNQHTMIRIEVATATTTELVTMPAPGLTASGVQFSRDGSQLYFVSPTSPDHLFPPFNPSTDAPAGLFRIDLSTDAVQKLTGFASFFSVSPDQHVAFNAAAADVGLDPEGVDSDGTREIYLLDPDAGGGFLWLKRGRLSPRTGGNDRFTFSGRLVQPGGGSFDPSKGAALTLLAANGQLLRSALPAGVIQVSDSRWSFRSAGAIGLTKLVVSRVDATHYSFAAQGNGSGLLASATPYVAVELEVGGAVFSNAQRFRAKGKQLLYP